MKKIIVVLALSTIFLRASAATSEECTKTEALSASPGANQMSWMQDSEGWQAYSAVATELTVIQSGKGISRNIDKLVRFEFSAPTKKKLINLFNNDKPLHVERRLLASGETAVDFSVDALHYQDKSGQAKGDSASLKGTVTFDKTFTKAKSTAAMPSFNYSDGSRLQIVGSDLRYQTEQRRSPLGVWLGSGSISLARMTIDGDEALLPLKFEDIVNKSELQQRANLLDMTVDTSLKSVSWGDDSVEAVHVAFRLPNLDAKTFAALVSDQQKLGQRNLTMAERSAASLKAGARFMESLLKHDISVLIQDISATYHGFRAGLSGHLELKAEKQGRGSQKQDFMKRLSGSFEAHVPMALVTEISRVWGRKTSEHQGKEPVSDEEVNKKSDSMVAKAIDDLRQKQLIRIDADTIRSTFEIKKGKFFVNGTDVSHFRAVER
ncbi:DUF945 family protein [Paraherbaspirillum soli]|uniref:DUF945 family protein n=1 Tax=Paraherbaspirillum soli TaxID=631222 RepID=A0ABW0M9K3_9BURK